MKWEYRCEGLDTSVLNNLGAEGWEAVSTVTDPQFNEYDRSVVVFHAHSVLLKRPLPASRCTCLGWCFFNEGHHTNCNCKADRHGIGPTYQPSAPDSEQKEEAK